MRLTSVKFHLDFIILIAILFTSSGCAIWFHGYSYNGSTYLTIGGALDAHRELSAEIVQSVTPRMQPNGKSLLCINYSIEHIRANYFEENFLTPGYDMVYLATSRQLLLQTLYESIQRSNIFTKTDIVTKDEAVYRYNKSYDYVLYVTCGNNADFYLKLMDSEPESVKMESTAETLKDFVHMFLQSLEGMVHNDLQQPDLDMK